MPPARLLKTCKAGHRFEWRGVGYVPEGWRLEICTRCGGHGRIEPVPSHPEPDQ